MTAKLIDGVKIANKIKEDLKVEIEDLKNKGYPPSLSAIQVGDNPGSKVYINAQKKSCEKMGITYNLYQFEENTTQRKLATLIQRLNQDPTVSGIILQMPLPEHLNTRALQHLIDSDKDAEGISPANMGMVVYGNSVIGPCTALAIMELIQSTEVDLYGKEAVVVGHSDIVGKPAALLLLNKFVTTSVCHIATGERGTLPEYVRNAEILIVAAGKANLIKGEWIREGAIVIDVGINRVQGKIVGDVEFDAAKEKAAYITPVPGGVGPVTTAMLLRNTVETAKLKLL